MNKKLSFVRKAGFVSLGTGFMVTSAISSAYAATPIPSTAEPSRLEKRFEDEGTSVPTNRLRTVSPGEAPIPQQIQQQMAQKKFVLKRVVLEGNTVFTQDQLAFAYKDKLGKQISLVDAQAIVKAITNYYRTNEYVLSQAIVPPQDVSSGTLKIRVLEGYVSEVRIDGTIQGDEARKTLEAYAAHIKALHPIKVSDLERYLLLMDDLPGANAKGVVKPSATKIGAADLVVTMGLKPFEASYTLDNRGTKTVGPDQHTATLAANSLFGVYDRSILRFITTSPIDELEFVDFQHEEQIGDEGTRFVVTGSYSKSEPGDFLKSSDLDSKSWFAQAKLLHPFLRSRPENLVGRIKFDVRDTYTNQTGTELNQDRLTVLRAGGNYDFADGLAGVDLIDTEVSEGLGILGATDPGAHRSRTNGEDKFTKINLDLTRTQPLPGDFSFFTAASGQYAFDPLLPAEQFTVGGASFGRAYDPGELAGDHGIAAKAELRYGQTLGDPLLESYQLYGFYDIGRVWIREGSPGANDKQSLADVGAGVRTNFSDNLSGDFQVAFPLTRDASNQGGHGDEGRLFFTVTARY